MHVVIIGNGPAAINALDNFRRYDRVSPVSIIAKERGPAYSRMLLPYWLEGRISHKDLFVRGLEYYHHHRAKVYFNSTVEKIDTAQGIARLKDKSCISYDRLLIAAGARPYKPTIAGLEGRGVHYLWTQENVKQLQVDFLPGKKLLVLGSGFIALQSAWIAVRKGLKVTICELMPRILPTAMDEQGARLLYRRMINYGVNIKVGTRVERFERKPNGEINVFIGEDKPAVFDCIIVGAGIRPNVKFLSNSQVAIDKGILVNNRMETNIPGIYAAGDVAQGPDYLGERCIFAPLWPVAVEQGKIAGANMAGHSEDYRGSLSSNIAQIFDLTVASVGCIHDESAEGLVYLDEKDNKYIKIFLRDQIPIGGVVVGAPEDVTILGCLQPFIRRQRPLGKNYFSGTTISMALLPKLGKEGWRRAPLGL